MSEETTTSYFKQRMLQLDVHEDNNFFDIRPYDYEQNQALNSRVRIPIFEEDKDGNIQINVWRLDRTQIIIDHPNADPLQRNINNNRTLPFALKRLKVPKKNGQKYDIPRGSVTYPFFPPRLVEKFEKSEEIQTLALTEGYFKAWKGDQCGMDVVGLSSITHFRDRKTGKIYSDVELLIRKCKVKNVVILHDADCRLLKQKAIDNGEDLFKRPNSFYSAAAGLHDALKDIAGEHNVAIYYGHIKPGLQAAYPTEPVKYHKTEETGEPEVDQVFDFVGHLDFMDSPKGLDDLFIAFSGLEKELVKDFNTWNPLDGKYFYKMNITYKTGTLRKYFHIRTAEVFYNAYASQIGGKQFIYHGTTYEYSQEDDKIKVVVPADAKKYARVGTDFYKMVQVPNKYKTVETILMPWSKSIITDDHGKNFLNHITKYEAFCNVPDHRNYQAVINNCYNLYKEFEWEPEEGDVTTSLNFIKHIFGIEPLEFEGHKFQSYELGLDYIQLLYQRPTQVLPILALVSKERETGKTTFGNWLKMIFKANATFVSNDDWFNSFNSTYTDKLLVMTEEALLDKKILLEKVKALSTGDKIQENRKGKEQVERDFFGKFLFFSNNETNFMYIEKEEKRFWVRKIPSIPKKQQDPRFKENLIEEIPAFLHFLDQRKLKTREVNRQWFDYSLTRTEALERVMANSVPRAEKQIREGIREWFLDYGCDEFLLTAKDVNQLFLANKYTSDLNYPKQILIENLKLEQYRNEKGKFVAKRYSYPIKIEIDGAEKTYWKKMSPGRPYVFKRELFISEDDEKNYATSDEEREKLKAEEALAKTEQVDQDFEVPEPIPDSELPFGKNDEP